MGNSRWNLTMKLYLLDDPEKHSPFASISKVGTWSEGGLCHCGQNTERAIEPMLIQWEPDSDIIGDFSWSMYTFAVNDRVKKYMTEHGFECKFGKTKVVRPVKPKRKKIVPFPYTGPKLHWIMPTATIELNEKKSGVEIEIDCADCKKRNYTFRRQGIVIDRNSWKGQRMFRIKQFEPSAATFLSEEGLNLLNSGSFTNLGYIESGVIR